MAQEQSLRDVPATPSEIAVRKIGVGDLWQVLKLGFDDFNAKPSGFVFLAVIYPLFALLLTLVRTGDNLLHLAFPMVAGFTFLGPVVSVGLFQMSRRRERGLDLTWRAAFDFVHSSSFPAIIVLSLAMMLLYVAWLFVAEFLFFGIFGGDYPGSVADFVTQVLTTRQGGALMFYGTAFGFAFAVAAMAISVVSFPMVVDRPVGAGVAAYTSVRALAANPLVMAVWGLIVVVLLAAGALVFLVGLAVVLPVLGHATWHLYRRLIAP